MGELVFCNICWFVRPSARGLGRKSPARRQEGKPHKKPGPKYPSLFPFFEPDVFHRHEVIWVAMQGPVVFFPEQNTFETHLGQLGRQGAFKRSVGIVFVLDERGNVREKRMLQIQCIAPGPGNGDFSFGVGLEDFPFPPRKCETADALDQKGIFVADLQDVGRSLFGLMGQDEILARFLPALQHQGIAPGFPGTCCKPVGGAVGIEKLKGGVGPEIKTSGHFSLVLEEPFSCKGLGRNLRSRDNQENEDRK